MLVIICCLSVNILSIHIPKPTPAKRKMVPGPKRGIGANQKICSDRGRADQGEESQLTHAGKGIKHGNSPAVQVFAGGVSRPLTCRISTNLIPPLRRSSSSPIAGLCVCLRVSSSRGSPASYRSPTGRLCSSHVWVAFRASSDVPLNLVRGETPSPADFSAGKRALRGQAINGVPGDPE